MTKIHKHLGTDSQKLSHKNMRGLTDDDHVRYLDKDGSKDFTGEQSMGTHKLTNVVDPAADQDAATKKYVDDNMPAETITCIAGESIGGADRPYAVFLKTSDNRVYVAESDQGGEELEVIGFAITTATAGNSITVQISGIVPGFIGAANLTQWSRYYLAKQSDTWWGSAPYTNISTTGTVQLGTAISTTELLLQRKRKVYKAGDLLIISSDTETGIGYSDNPPVYKITKEIALAWNGKLRIKFDMRSVNGYGAAKIYRNGVAVGTEQTNTDNTWTNKSEDIGGWETNDLLQLYAHGSYWKPQSQCYVKNLRIYSTEREVSIVTQDVA